MDTKTKEEAFFAESTQRIREYCEDRILLLKLQIVEKISNLIATIFSGLIIAIIGFFILLFLSVMLAFWLASLTGSLYIGFGIVVVLYVIIFFAIIVWRKKIIEPSIMNAVIDIFFEQPTNGTDAKA